MSKQRELISRSDRRQLVAFYVIPSLMFFALTIFFAFRGQIGAVVFNVVLTIVCALLAGWMSRAPVRSEEE